MKVLTLRDTNTDAWVSVSCDDEMWADLKRRAVVGDLQSLTDRLEEENQRRARQRAPYRPAFRWLTRAEWAEALNSGDHVAEETTGPFPCGLRRFLDGVEVVLID